MFTFEIDRFLAKVSVLGFVLFVLTPALASAENFELSSLKPLKFSGIEQELCELYLAVVEDAVDFFEPLWQEDSSVPDAGFFDFRRYDDWKNTSYNYAPIIVIPGTGMVLLDYAVLLTETDKENFGALGLSRDILQNRIFKAIRWCCLTSAYVENPFPYLPNTPKDLLSDKYWKREPGRRADLIGYLTLGTAKLWDRIDPETQALFRAIATGGAQRLRHIRKWTSGQGGNHDQVKQDLSSTFGAAFLFSDDTDAHFFRSAITGNAIDMVSTLQDKTKNILAEGKPVKEWSEGWNLYEDYSSDHHGHANIWYGGDMVFEGRSYVDILAHLTGKEVPKTFTYGGNGFDGVLEWLKVLCLAGGGLMHPHGAEYDSYYGSGLLAFCYGSSVKKDRLAAALEQQAAKLLLRHTRAVQKYDYHRGSWAKAAMAYLMHKQYSPSAVPLELGQALRSLDGTYHYPQQQCLIHRSPGKWVSFSWGSRSAKKKGKGFCGFVVPQGTSEESFEPLVYSHPNSLTGILRTSSQKREATTQATPGDVYNANRSDKRFSTTGCITQGDIQRYQAFLSFEEGPCITFAVLRALQDATVTWSGMPIYFYVRPGITGERMCNYEGGFAPTTGLGDKESSWWSVNDRLGMTAIGGSGRIRGGRTVGFNWARKDSYKDKCDFVAVSPLDQKKMKAGETVDVGAAIYVNRLHDEVRKYSRTVQDLSRRLPQGWKGLLAPIPGFGGGRILAVSNFYGRTPDTELRLSFPEGAPVLEEETEIIKNEARSVIQVSRLESLGETLDWYIEVTQGKGVRARKIAFDRVELVPSDHKSCRIRIRYAGNKGERILFKNTSGRVLKEEPTANARFPGSLEWHLTERLVLQCRGKEIKDDIGPAVEIAEIAPQTNGKLKIRVFASDRSGVRDVKLYCDDSLVGEDATPPFEWTFQPEVGWHSFRAQATDASVGKNLSTSFFRTKQIGNPK